MNMRSMKSMKHEPAWSVRHVDDLPIESLEGIKIVRVLRGTAFENIGCEYVVLDKGQHLDSHVHDEANSFIFVLSGHGIVDLGVEDKFASLSIGPGHLVYIPAGIPHAFKTLEEPMVMYGFQSPPIIQDDQHVDIVFQTNGARGELGRY